MANICVFCASSNSVNGEYALAARETGALIGRRNHTLIYGGSNLGLMRLVARSVQDNGGKVVGILPEIFKHLAYREDELVIVEDLRKRKKVMESRSDAFLVLPGGFGTLDELADLFVERQLKLHQKPVAIINTNKFYSNLMAHFEKMYTEGFAPLDNRNIYSMVNTPLDALEFIENYSPQHIGEKLPNN